MDTSQPEVEPAGVLDFITYRAQPTEFLLVLTAWSYLHGLRSAACAKYSICMHTSKERFFLEYDGKG